MLGNHIMQSHNEPNVIPAKHAIIDKIDLMRADFTPSMLAELFFHTLNWRTEIFKRK